MDCEWSDWERSTPCSGSCGSGQQTLTRKKIHTQRVSPPTYDHNNHYHDHYDHHHDHYDHYQHRGYKKRSAYYLPGKECYGETTKTERCSLHPCPSM